MQSRGFFILWTVNYHKPLVYWYDAGLRSRNKRFDSSVAWSYAIIHIMTTIITLIKKLIFTFVWQIIFLILGIIIRNRVTIIWWWSIIQWYPSLVRWLIIMISLIIIPLWSIWLIKSALTQTVWSYIIRHHESDITHRVVDHYNNLTVHNSTITTNINRAKTITQEFPGIIQWILNQIIDQIPVFNEIFDSLSSFNPINLTSEQVSSNLTALIHTKLQQSSLGTTSLWSIYFRPILGSLGISIIISITFLLHHLSLF